MSWNDLGKKVVPKSKWPKGSRKCENCHGKGYLETWADYFHECWECDGTGYTCKRFTIIEDSKWKLELLIKNIDETVEILKECGNLKGIKSFKSSSESIKRDALLKLAKVNMLIQKNNIKIH